MSENWVSYVHDQCPLCGDDLEVSVGDDGEIYDGQNVRCVCCGAEGSITVDEDGDTYANFTEV